MLSPNHVELHHPECNSRRCSTDLTGIDLPLIRSPVIAGNLLGFRLTTTCSWYLTMEISRRAIGIIEALRSLGSMCKNVSDVVPLLVSQCN